MSDNFYSDNNLNHDNDDIRSEEVQRYRQERVNQFRLNINSNEDTKADAESDFSDEITSFSTESTKAQIERASKKELRRQKKEQRKIQRIKANRNKRVYQMSGLVIIIMMCVIVSQFLVVGSNDFLAIKREDDTEAKIVIEETDSIDDISAKLKAGGVIDSPVFFTLFSNITGKSDDIDPGTYLIPKNKDYLGIINYMRDLSVSNDTITLQITEGTSIPELAEILLDAGVIGDVDKFLELCDSDEFDDEYDFVGAIDAPEDRVYKLEGYMFPDTYEFYADEEPDVTIRRFLANFQTKIYETDVYPPGYMEPVTIGSLIDESEYTLDEIVTMASLVQAEAANVDDMYNVSSVINNRLDYGYLYSIHTLGLDCTAFYPYDDAESAPEGYDSPYETYDTEGLPPGAVCSAGSDAFMAALVPNYTDYLYFCHGTDSDGVVTAYYATNFSDHSANLSAAGLQ